MLGKTNILTIIEFSLVILAHVSCALDTRLDLAQLIKESFGPRLHYQYTPPNKPVVRDVSYLPEEDSEAEDEARQNELQQLDRDNRNLMPEYRNLCETITRRVEIADDNYEYQPSHYHEVFCKSYSLMTDNERISEKFSKQLCVHPGFHCVQRSRLLFLVRRSWDDECWESYTKEIASGCDCMWPVTTLGEITAHY